MKPLRKIKLFLCYFLILIVFSQCKTGKVLYQYPDTLVLTDIKLRIGAMYKVTLQSGKQVLFKFAYVEKGYIIGTERVKAVPHSRGRSQISVQIPSKEIVKIEFRGGSYEGAKYLGYILLVGVAILGVVSFVAVLMW